MSYDECVACKRPLDPEQQRGKYWMYCKECKWRILHDEDTSI
jgi:DNA-directed RNA polymerase subunit RPC12/RpoP